jgi:transposase
MLVRVYGDAAVSWKAVYKWLERFHGGGAESAEGEQHSGRPSTSTTDVNVSKVN